MILPDKVPAVNGRPDGGLDIEKLHLLHRSLERSSGAEGAVCHHRGGNDHLFVPLLRLGPVIVEAGLHHIQIIELGTVIEGFKHLRVCIVVGFHDADVLAGGGIEAGVHADAVAAVGLVNHLHPGVGGGVFVQNGAAGIGGAVIHRNDFQLPEGLVHHAVHALAQILFHIVNRYHHGYLWHSRCLIHSLVLYFPI